MATKGGIQLIDTFRYSGKRYIDLRQHCASLGELRATAETSIPEGFTKYCEETEAWYEWKSSNDSTAETGKWRKCTPIEEALIDNYIFAITDKEENLLLGIRDDGEVVYNKGMSDEVRGRFKELEGIYTVTNDIYVFAITDKDDRLLFGIRKDGTVVYDKGIPGEVKPILNDLNERLTDARERLASAEEAITDIKERMKDFDGYRIIEDENFIFAITDKDDSHMLFGIGRDGSIKMPKGTPDEIAERMERYSITEDENHIFSITDNDGRFVFGVRKDGRINAPKGIIEIMSAEEYRRARHYPHTLYIIQDDEGRLHQAILNGKTLTTGEEYGFFTESNMLYYHGDMVTMPIIWIDHEEMTLNIEYPSNYNGPMFVNEDGMLFAV